MVIGDPLQIEPVVPRPWAIVRILAERHGVSEKWSPVAESIQTLADRTMTFGAHVGGMSGRVAAMIAGAIAPIFETASAIAYDGVTPLQRPQGMAAGGGATAVRSPASKAALGRETVLAQRASGQVHLRPPITETHPVLSQLFGMLTTGYSSQVRPSSSRPGSSLDRKRVSSWPSSVRCRFFDPDDPSDGAPLFK